MSVGDDVMQGQQQDITRGANTEQIGAHWRTGFKVERLDGCATQRGIECCIERGAVGAAQIVQATSGPRRAFRCLSQLAIRALEEACAQTLMLLRDAA
ncbi:hypothetical protein R69658_07904 [Paraburkholderia aspalathi]|uniref:Uncharacterized protein n=1 Tax=Paraburkholderia aspalathi TaxID=1324617 RepID=A0ABN7NGG6_9BURK|nr:hypothetical protein R69658_07904 [Paraburkholderia aspalathi]